MKLPVTPPYPPMEALAAARIPEGEEWQYEPKWDGFRCLAFREGDEVELQSKAGLPLARYFPEMAAVLAALAARQFVLDGELVIPIGGRLSFNDLQLRLHPAESRVRKLAAEHPAMMIAFDLLADQHGHDLTGRPLSERRRRLEEFFARYVHTPSMRLSPVAHDWNEARKWLRTMGGSLDGVIAKRLNAPYESGRRSGAMQKIKDLRTADCVVGGFRYASKGGLVGSLLLGLYDDAGKLNHVGFTSSIAAADKKELTAKLERLRKPPGFTAHPAGPAAGAPNGRANGSRSTRGWWWRCSTTTSPAGASGTARGSFAGVRIKTRASAGWRKWNTRATPRSACFAAARHNEGVITRAPFVLWLCAGLLAAQTATTAELQPATLQAFDRYIQATEARLDAQVKGRGSFLWVDASPERLKQVRAGQVLSERWGGRDEVKVSGGLIHDWIGAVFIPGATLDKTLALVQSYDNHKNIYKPEVIDSRLIGRNGQDYKIYLRLLKKKVLTVVLNTNHDVRYFPMDAKRCYSRSYSTRIAEVADAGKPGEHEMPLGKDHGFLWRLYSYWRFEERDGGVYVECEAISLTRNVPTGLGWLIEPIIRNLPRESLANTLSATRGYNVHVVPSGEARR